MYQLSKLRSLVKKRQRIGRGGSRGGTSGRGHKGQKARSGAHLGFAFEGGQMPLARRLPKRGFNNSNYAIRYSVVGLDILEANFAAGATVTKQDLHAKGLISLHKSKKNGLIKILGGTITKNLMVHADAFSETARKAIEGCGGQALVTKEK